MKYFLDNIYLVFFSPTEFPYFWGQYRSHFSEGFTILSSAFSLSLGICIQNSNLSEFGTLVSLFFLNLGFFLIFPKIFASLVTQKILELGILANQKIFISYLNYSLFVFLFLPSLVVFVNFFELGGSGIIISILFGISLIYFFYVIQGIGAIYNLETGTAISILLTSLYKLIVLPLFLVFYYLLTFLFLLL